MANRIGLNFHRRLPVPTAAPSAVWSANKATNSLKRWTAGGKPGRRLILGLGVSFSAQFMNMSGSLFGARSFVASARQKNAVDEVIRSPSFNFLVNMKKIPPIRFFSKKKS